MPEAPYNIYECPRCVGFDPDLEPDPFVRGARVGSCSIRGVELVEEKPALGNSPGPCADFKFGR